MLCRVAYDEHDGDLDRMMADAGKLLRHNFRMLADAGCRNIQVDEPLFTMADEDEVAKAVAAINLAIQDLPDEVHVSTHICQGNYAVGKEYDGQIGHRYFDVGHYKAGQVCGIECSSFLVEYDMAHHYRGLLGDRQLGVGRSTSRIPRSKAAKPSSSASAPAPGWRPSRPSSPPPAASITCRAAPLSANCGQ